LSLSDDVGLLLAPLHGTFGFFARNLTTGEVAEVNAHQVLPTESAAKTFILIHYSKLVAIGACDSSTRVAVPDDFRFDGTGVLRFLSPGLSLSVDDLAWLMTIVSDNVATALLLLEVGGPEAVNQTMEDLGSPTARLATFEEMLAGAPFGSSTARDLAEAYAHLDEPAREKLSRQQDLTGLPRRLNWSPYGSTLGRTPGCGASTRQASARLRSSTQACSRPIQPDGSRRPWPRGSRLGSRPPTTLHRLSLARSDEPSASAGLGIADRSR